MIRSRAKVLANSSQGRLIFAENEVQRIVNTSRSGSYEIAMRKEKKLLNKELKEEPSPLTRKRIKSRRLDLYQKVEAVHMVMIQKE